MIEKRNLLVSLKILIKVIYGNPNKSFPHFNDWEPLKPFPDSNRLIVMDFRISTLPSSNRAPYHQENPTVALTWKKGERSKVTRISLYSGHHLSPIYSDPVLRESTRARHARGNPWQSIAIRITARAPAHVLLADETRQAAWLKWQLPLSARLPALTPLPPDC